MHSGTAAVERQSGATGNDGADMSGADKAQQIFDRVMAQLKVKLGGEAFSSWFGRMQLAEHSKGIVRLSVPTAFLRAWINNHYVNTINDLWAKEDDALLKLEVIVRSSTRPAKTNHDAPAETTRRPAKVETFGAPNAAAMPSPKPEWQPTPRAAAPEGALVHGSPLDGRYTFESFIEGPSNRVAHAAARAVAEQHASAVRYNPLFLHASVGLGKTHLLQAIAAETQARNPKARVLYLTAEYFMWRFATAIRDNNALALKEQLRDIDLLIIDDMQFLQGKSIQHEFCHLINLLLDSARQVVVAADRPPAELESIEPRIRSRLNGGVALEMGAPDYAMRFSILKQRLDAAQAEDASISIPDEILSHVARTVAGSGRDLEGAFNQVLIRRYHEPQLSVERIDELLGHIYRTGEPKRVRIEDIQRVVARHYNVSKTDLLSNRRTRTIVKPR
ncbi:chromosomal replication initiator protein DnaA, partial [Salmonella enterica subsp. enterica]|nr:chromosomal replication initiator protein DnaA [Salmonella enterica subsp. enterica serovar Enteritidis]